MMAQWRAHIALFLVALIYGANYTIAKEVLDNDYIRPMSFIVLRALTGVVLFWMVHRIFVRERIHRSDIGLLILCGLFGVALNQSFFFLGLRWTQPIHASLLMTAIPVMVLLASAVLLKERITWQKTLGIAIGGIGAILLITQGHAVHFSRQQIIGDLLILLNACSYGLYLVLVKRLMRKYHPLTVIKWVFFFGFTFVFPAGISDVLDVRWATFTEHIWLAVAYVLLFTTFFAYLLNILALKHVSPTTVGFYVYLQPVLATLVAVALSRDHLTAMKVVSALLIFAGVFLVSRPAKAVDQA